MKTLLYLIVLFSFVVTANSQILTPELISSSGDSYRDHILSIEWSLGEIVVETVVDHNFTLTQGFHQAMVEITIINETKNTGYDLNVFPNPAGEQLNIKASEIPENGLDVYIYSMFGEEVVRVHVESNFTSIPLHSLKPAEYIVRLFSENQEVKTLMLVKL